MVLNGCLGFQRQQLEYLWKFKHGQFDVIVFIKSIPKCGNPTKLDQHHTQHPTIVRISSTLVKPIITHSLTFIGIVFFGNKEMIMTPKKKNKHFPALRAVKISSIIYCPAIY